MHLRAGGARQGFQNRYSACNYNPGPGQAPCPPAFSASFDYTLDEGTNTLSFGANDLVANNAPGQAWVERIDRSAPTIGFSGPLYDGRNAYVGANDPVTVNVTATDGTLTPDSAQRSGATALTVILDGQSINGGTVSQPCTAPEGSCSLSANITLTPDDLANLDPGDHTISATATDALGHATSQPTTFTFKLAAASAANAGTGDTGYFTFVGDGGARVNVANGNLLVTQRDLADSDADDHVVVDRAYNSLASPVGSTIGARWSFDVGPTTRIDQGDDGSLTLSGPTGYRVELDPDGFGGYLSPDGFDGELTATGSGYVLYRYDEQQHLSFDASGALTQVTDAQGRVFSVQDTSAGATTVLGSFGTLDGQRADLLYTGDALVRELDDPASGHHMYGQTAGRLTSYTAPAESIQYSYDDNGLLSGQERGDGSGFTAVNLPDGRVQTLTVTDADGTQRTWQFDYTVAGQTTVMAPDGPVSTYHYDGDGRVIVPDGQGDPPEDTSDDPSLTAPYDGVYVPDPTSYEQTAPEGTVIDTAPDATDLEADDGGQTFAPFMPGRFTVKAAWATVRNGAKSLVIGNAVHHGTFDVKVRGGGGGDGGSSFFGRLYAHTQGCGWVFVSNAPDRTGGVHSTCGTSSIAATTFAQVVNCDRCNEAQTIRLRSGTDANGDPMPANIPLYRNVRPFATERAHDRLPTPLPTTYTTTKGEIVTTHATQVAWRYISRAGRYALIESTAIDPTGLDKWGFIEAKYLPDETALCNSVTTSHGGSPVTPTRHHDWPKVCQLG